MPHALKGFQKYKGRLHPELKPKFQELKFSQKPKTLFITCADSRILPNHITQTGPGDLFTVRNAGNTINAKDALTGPCANIASVEYGISILKIEEIVICGHAQCGAIDAALNQVPNVNTELGRYLTQFEHLKEAQRRGEITDLKSATIYNVKKQIENLLTYDFIVKRIESHELVISGWYYDFAQGEVEIVESIGELQGELVDAV